MGRLQQVEEHLRLPVQLSQLVVQVLNLQERLQLPRDAAYVLPAQHMSRVGAVLQIALVEPAHDAPGIVAHMLVAHRAGIGAIIDFSIRVTGNPSRVRVHRHIFRAVDVLDSLHGDVFYAIAHLRAVGIDAAQVLAIVDRPLVAAADAPRAVVACDIGRGLAAADFPRGPVGPGDAAHVLRPGHVPGDAAVLDPAVVDPGQYPHLALAAAGSHRPRQGKAPHHAALLHIAEQPHSGAVGSKLQTGNRMLPAIEDAAEAGDGQAAVLPQDNVVLQGHILIPGPGVHLAVQGQPGQILLRGYGYPHVFALRSPPLPGAVPGNQLSECRGLRGPYRQRVL